MKKSIFKLSKNVLITLGVPALIYFLIKGLTLLGGHDNFGVGQDWNTIVYLTVFSGLIALAVSYNLTSGRFDFSVGSVLLFATIAGGNLALEWKVGPIEFMLIVLVIGAVMGTVSGLIYIWLRIPPMVVSLGVAMIYEAFGKMIKGGEGVTLTGSKLLIFSKQPVNLILLAGILIILIYMLNFTKFGYNTNSLRTGQKFAVSVGINEKRNAVACYVIAGVLMAAAGLVNISKNGYLAPSAVALDSSMYLMSAFLPMFIGEALKKYSDKNIGVIVGAFIASCITSGFTAFKPQLESLGLSFSSLREVADGAIVLIFLVYSFNSYKFGQNKMFQAKKQRAIAEQQELQIEKT